MNTAFLGNSSWENDREPSLEENRGKIADFFGETRFKVNSGSPHGRQNRHWRQQYAFWLLTESDCRHYGYYSITTHEANK